MAGNITWQSGGISLSMQASGQGNQLTNGSAVQLTNYLDNTGASGGPNFYALAELYTSQSGYSAAINAGNTIDFYLVPSRDGTNYADANTIQPYLPPPQLKGSFITTSGNSHARMMLEGIPLMPVKYQGYIQNNLGVTLTSGWSLFISTYAEAYT